MINNHRAHGCDLIVARIEQNIAEAKGLAAYVLVSFEKRVESRGGAVM